MNDPIERLSKIQSVEAPPYLYTRIEAKISQVMEENIPKSWAIASVSLGCIALVMNVLVLSNSNLFSKQNQVKQYSSFINLHTSQQLYYE